LLSSANISTRSGRVRFTIGGSATDTFEVASFSPMRFDYGIDRGEPVIDTVRDSYGAITVNAFDQTENQRSLYDLIRAETDGQPGQMILESDGVDYFFPFTIRKNGLRYDERERMTEILFSPPTIAETGVFALIDGAGSDIKVFDGGGMSRTANCVSAHVLVREVLEEFSSSASNLIRVNTVNQSYTLGPDTYNLVSLFDPTYTTNRVYFVVARFTNASVIGTFGRLAALQGAMYGSAFNTNFYVQRNNLQDTVTLTADDLDDITFIETSRAVRSLQLRLVNTDTSGNPISNIRPDTIAERYFNRLGAPIATPLVFDNDDDRRVSLGYNLGNNLEIGVYDGTGFNGDGVMNVIRNGATSDQQPESFLLGILPNSGGIDNYVTAYGAGSNRIKIKCVINDVFALKPWETFQFDTSVPLRYRNRVFRPSSMDYNFIDGTIRVEAFSLT
jgi:hypothetical protein